MTSTARQAEQVDDAGARGRCGQPYADSRGIGGAGLDELFATIDATGDEG